MSARELDHATDSSALQVDPSGDHTGHDLASVADDWIADRLADALQVITRHAGLQSAAAGFG
jgi:hypothetical protein